jgi:hypothetical protein
VKPRHASPQQPNGLSRGASMRFNAHAIGGIKNLKGATELELNYIVRRHIKWAAYEPLPPFRNRPGPQRSSRTPLGTAPRLAQVAHALPSLNHRTPPRWQAFQANSPRVDVTAW